MADWLTAAAIATGTATPTPRHMWTATPTATPTDTPVYIPLEEVTPTPTTPAPTSTPTAIPAVLVGKIAFLTDRDGDEAVYIMNPDGSGLARLTNPWAYDVANIQDTISPDGQNRVLVQDIQGVPQLIMQPIYNGYSWRIINSAFACYHPSWSPDGEYIAFVSQSGGHWSVALGDGAASDLRAQGVINDDIYLKPIHGLGIQRLTDNGWIFEKHPSWSPDGTQIVFCSNREAGRSQIWVMNADGSNPRNLSNDPHNNWDPVWIKWPELLKALP
jgi:TolB protein